MNESSLKYAAYKALLEGDITRGQYEFITEAGLVSRIIKSLKSAGGAAAKTYKDEAYNDAQEYASQQLQKIVKQIYQAGTKAGQKKEEIDPIIAMILNQAMVDSKIENPALVFRALEKSPEALEAVSEPSAASSSATGGGTTVVTTNSIAANPGVAAALAAGPAGSSAADAAADAEKSKKNTKDILKAWIDGIVTGTGVEEKKTKKIAKALLDGEHIKIDLSSLAESLRRMRRALVEKKASPQDPILERWQRLAGLSGKKRLLKEDVADDFIAALEAYDEKKDGDFLNYYNANKVNEIPDDETAMKIANSPIVDKLILKSKDPELDAAKSFYSYYKKAASDGEVTPEEHKALEPLADEANIELLEPDDKEGAAGKVSGDGKAKVGDGSSKAGGPEASSAESSEYQNAFKDVRKRIADESITDDEILKVIKYIDVKDAKDAPLSIV
jgi:hypothetical protein